ncbi:MAG: NAD(+)/NADH kinase [Holophagaceae bacterium]|nr:NAD(+)/NADH kinase [Holophagaceae bacterium]
MPSCTGTAGCIMSQGVLNDAVIGKGALARIMDLDLQVDGEDAATSRPTGLHRLHPHGLDGLLLSAGGPILHPARTPW